MATGNRTVDDISGEEWRPVWGSGGWYSVSNIGRVRRHPVTAIGSDGRRLSFGEHLLGQLRNHDGYIQVRFSRLCPHRLAQPLVHRLVFEAFRHPLLAGTEINHINGVKDDNRVENLEAITHPENMRHASRTGLMRFGESTRTALLKNSEVLEIVDRWERGERVSPLSRAFGVTRSTVSNILAGRVWGRVTGRPRIERGETDRRHLSHAERALRRPA